MQTNKNFATNIWSGAGNPTATLAQLAFTVTTVTNAAGNAQFASLPALSTNGSLTFTPKPHSFGTNVVTVTLTDNNPIESTNSGGVKTFATNFLLEVAQISHVPTITPATTQTVLENGSGIYITNNVWNYDAISNNLALTAVSAPITNSLPSVVTVTITATNVVSATNTQFTLHLVPVANKYGTNVITLTAKELAGTSSTTNATFNVVVTHVAQPPSFVFATNTVSTPEQAVATVITSANFLTAITNGSGNLAPYTNWTFAVTASNTALFNVQPAIAHNGTLTFTPRALTNGICGVKVVMTNTDAGESTANGGVITFTTNFMLAITYVSTTPTFAFATNTLVVPEESPTLTNLNFVTSINAGLGKAASTTWTFTTLTVTNELGTNAQFISLPVVATNGTLTFAPIAHSYGTNLVTVIMTDSGTTNGSYTNTFNLAVAQIAHAPSITWATNQTTLENTAGLTAVINVWDYDAATNNLFLTAVSSNSSVAQVSVIGTNWINATNVQFTVALTPVTNMFGSSVIELTASESITNLLLQTATNFLLTVGQVSQPPSFTFATNVLTVPEHAGTIITTNFLTGITTGAGNPNGLTWTFTLFPQSAPGNVPFALGQEPALTTDGTLSFATLGYNFGTNTITVVMTDSGSIVNGGTIAYTNSFTLQVPWVNQVPSFGLGVSSVTVDKYNVPVTISNAAINILAGPPNESSQSVSFQVSNNNGTLFTSQPAVDANGTLTFTPGDQAGTVTVQIGAQDNGGTANGGVDTSTNQTFTIVIPPNTFQNATGTFAGVFYGSNTLAEASSGYLNLSLSTNGMFSGYLLCGNDSNSFNGQFDIGQSLATVRTNNYTLNLTVDTISKTISGSVSNTAAQWSSAVQAFPTGYSGDALTGAYTLSMPGLDNPKIASLGDSALQATIADSAVTLTGYIADSNQLNSTGPLCANGFSPVYQPLYTNGNGAHGLLIGWLNFNGVAINSDSPGSTLIWITQTNASNLYPNGFTNSTQPLISPFVVGGEELPINQSYVEMTGGGLTIPFVEAVAIVNNQILTASNITNNGNYGLTLTINTNTGEVNGQFVDKNGITNVIESIMLENDEVARGYFLGAGQSGSFSLVANALLSENPPFPAFFGVHASSATNSALTIAGLSAAGITNLVIPENTTNDTHLSFSLYDPLTSAFNLTILSANTNVVAVTLHTNSATSYQLAFAPVANIYSNTTVTVTVDDGTLTNTFTIVTAISYVNQVPSFTLATNAYTVDSYGKVFTAPNAVTNISAGPPSENWQTVGFIVTPSDPSKFLVQPAVDASGTLTFTPGSVAGVVSLNVQAQDTGGTTNGGVDTSAAQVITITIPPNPFTSLLSDANRPGTFIGLFSDTNMTPVNLGSSGYFSLILTNDGTFSGDIVCSGTTNAFLGQFSISQTNATVTTGSYTLNLLLDPNAATVSGTVVSSSPWTSTLQSYLAAQPTPVAAGTYLVALPGLANSVAGPVGDSIFTVAIDAAGVASLSGFMADGTAVSLISQLSAGGNCPIYTPIYTNNANTGLLFGWLNFTNDVGNDLTAGSSLTWFNNLGATPAIYSAGFTNSSVPVASAYTSVANELAGISHYAVLTGGGFGASLVTNAVTIINNAITVDPFATNNLSLAIDQVTGELTGSFTYGSETNYITSLILQKTNVAYGYFTSADGTQAGSIVLLTSYSVPAVNGYPEITGFTNLTLLESPSPAQFQMAFTLFDPLTNDFVSVTAAADTHFVTVSVTGTGTSRTLNITPVADTFTNGAAIIITADDGTLTSTTTNYLTVRFVNQAPTFVLGDVPVTVDQYDVPVTVSNALVSITVGPDNGGGLVQFKVSNDSSNLFVIQPEIDTNGTLTFTPGYAGGTATIQVLAQDSMGTNYGGADTSGAQGFTIMIPNNPFQNVMGGNLTATFAGLFYDTNNIIPTSSGYVSLTLTNDGGFNISLVSVGATNTVSGNFSISNATANVAVANYSVDLLIDTSAGTVVGSVSNTAATWNVPLQTYLATNSVVSGYYTVTLPGFDDVTEGPVGFSILTVGISNNGAATVAGFMADNTAVNQASYLSAAGFCPIYIPMYATGTNGLLIGWLNFTNDPTDDILSDDSSLMWFNAHGATPNLYPLGFTNQAVCFGSPYATNAGYATDLLGASTSSGYGYALLSGGNLGADPVVKRMGITNNVISVVSSKDHSISLTLAPSTGLITGWYVEPNGISNNIEGVIIQNCGYSTGYFFGANTNQSGSFLLYGN